MCVFLYVTKWSSGLPKLKPKDSWGTMGTHTSSETEIQFILDIPLTTSTTPLHRGAWFCLHRTLCSALLLSAHQVTSVSWHFKVVFDPSKSLKIIFFRLALQCAAFKDKKVVCEWDQEQKVQFCDSSNGTPTFHTDYLPWISYLRQNLFFLIRKRGLVSEVLTCYAQIIPSLLNSERLRKDRLSSHFLLSLLILTLAISQSGAYTSISFRRGEGNSRGKARSIKMTF